MRRESAQSAPQDFAERLAPAGASEQGFLRALDGAEVLLGVRARLAVCRAVELDVRLRARGAHGQRPLREEELEHVRAGHVQRLHRAGGKVAALPGEVVLHRQDRKAAKLGQVRVAQRLHARGDLLGKVDALDVAADGLLHAVALLALDLLQAVEQVLALRLPVERHLRHERAGQHRILVAGEVARQVSIALLVAEEEALALRRQVLGHVPDELKAREHLLNLDAVAAGHALAQLPGFYRKYLSPMKVYTHCIYIPTCSEYALEAIEKYGAFKGGLLTVWRILRCNPFAKGGYDPVP